MDHSWLTLLDARVPRYTSYPTAPHFHPRIGSAIFENWLKDIDPQKPISLYVHVPFCHQLCWYCGCNTHIVKGERPVELFLKNVLKEIALVQRYLPGRPKVSHLHFGGGSPNRLTADQFDQIMLQLHQTFELIEGAEIALEIDPRHLDHLQTEAYARWGVNRASLGVQDFDPEVQKAMNRIQPFDMVAGAVDLLRKAGITAINFDLLYGLPLQTIDSIHATIEQTALLSPDRVALFGYAHVPWIKKQQKTLERFGLPSVQQRAELAFYARSELEKHYEPIGIDHFAKADDSLAVAARKKQLHRNFQGYTIDEAQTLIAFGPSGISSTPQGFAQKEPELAAWNQCIEAGQLAIRRGIALQPSDRLRSAIIEQIMCHLGVDVEAIAREHSQTPEQLLPCFDRLASFAAQGLVTIEGWRLSIPENRRLAARSVSAAFDAYFQPEENHHSAAV